ncbi:hypothetical protein QJQ45_009626 [Haematococcus lacustris]|nr:hypothetical protein QJQ45_009626 [Haematococcus lacustris]
MGLVALLPEDSSLLELLPHDEWMHELQINECATKAAGQTIKGDALLVSDVSHIRAVLADSLLLAATPFTLDLRQPLRPCTSAAAPQANAAAGAAAGRRAAAAGGPAAAAAAGAACVPGPGGSVTPQQLKQELSSLPAVLLSAAKHGNGSALGVHAQLLEASGQAESALRVWRRCAKAGDVEGQLRLGCACYQGAAGSSRDQDLGQELLGRGGEVTQKGCVSDSEAAQQWLSKGVRGLLGISSLSHFSVDITAQTVTLAYPDAASPAEPQPGPADPGAAPDGPGARPRAWVQASRRQQQAGREGPSSTPGHPGAPAAMSRTSVVVPFHQLWQLREQQQQQQQQQAGGSSRSKPHQHHQLSRQKEVGEYTGEADTLNHVLASAAIILGFMHFDGDGGMRVDQALACNLFKLAALAGSREAAQVLGWMFSTGQYGGSSM